MNISNYDVIGWFLPPLFGQLASGTTGLFEPNQQYHTYVNFFLKLVYHGGSNDVPIED